MTDLTIREFCNTHNYDPLVLRKAVTQRQVAASGKRQCFITHRNAFSYPEKQLLVVLADSKKYREVRAGAIRAPVTKLSRALDIPHESVPDTFRAEQKLRETKMIVRGLTAYGA